VDRGRTAIHYRVNPIFGESAAFDRTLLNFPAAETTVTIGAGSLINGAVLTNGSLMVNGAMRLNR
jgi:hypothetical protein